MRLIFTVIASGFLILTELPAEQPPPPVPYLAQSEPGVGAAQPTIVESDDGELTTVVVSSNQGDWAVSSSPVTYLGLSASSYPVEAEQNPVEAQQSPAVESVRGQEGPALLPVEAKATATPVANSAPKAIGTVEVMASYRQQSTLPITGYAMFYNPNVMQEVLKNRLAMGHVSACGECVGIVALLRAGDLNRRVWLQWGDGTVEGPFLVADVAAPQHVAQLLARNWVVDVDHRTAVRRGMAGPVLVTVWGSPPPANQENPPPFAPLYSVLPTASPVATSGPLLLQTPVATNAPVPAGVTLQGGFPTETPVPTITPLPAINLAGTPTGAQPATTSPLPTATSTLPLATGAAPAVGAAPTTSGVILRGFPTETPVPTITPLPAIHVAVTATGTLTPTPMPTLIPTTLPTLTPSVMPLATALLPETQTNISQRGFPTETPIPTITPLPAISPLPPPTATPSPN